MKEDKNLNSTDSGFELDKFDIEKLRKPASLFAPTPKSSTKVKKKHTPKPTPKHEVPVAPQTVSAKTKFLLIFASVVVVATTALLLIVAKNFQIQLPFYKTEKISKPETYISVGPVMVSVRNGDQIKITLDINCVKKKYHSKIIGMDSQIRNRVIWALQSPKAEQLLAAGDYIALRAYLSATLMEIVPPDTVSEIYISEFLRY